MSDCKSAPTDYFSNALEYFTKSGRHGDICIRCQSDDTKLYVNKLYLSMESTVLRIMLDSTGCSDDTEIPLDYTSKVIISWLSLFHPIDYKMNPIEDMLDIPDTSKFLELCCQYDTMKHFNKMATYLSDSNIEYSVGFIKNLYQVQAPCYTTLQCRVLENIIISNEHKFSEYIPSKFLFSRLQIAYNKLKKHRIALSEKSHKRVRVTQ